MRMSVKTNTAVVVPVNVVPLTDDTDFKTIETAVAYNAAGMALKWNFMTPAGVVSQTAVTPTTAGVYDWTHLGGGMYSIEIPASGGASINNNAIGYGWFSGVATGVLPWVGPMVFFGPEKIVDSLVNGTDNLEVDAVQLAGVTQSLADLKDFADAGYDPVTHSIVLVQTTSVNSDMRGTDGAYTGTPPTASDISTQVNSDITTAHGSGSYQTATGFAVAGDAMALTSGERTSLAAVIWNSLTSGFLTVGSIGKRIVDYLTGDAYARLGAPVGASVSADIAAVKADAAAILIDTDELQSSLVDGGRLDLIFDSILVHANSLDATKITTDRAAVLSDWANEGRLDQILDMIAASTSTSIPASITALGSPSQAGDEMDLVDAPNATAIDAIVLALLKRDWTGITGESARSALNALRALRNKFTVAAGIYTVTKENDSTTAWTASVTTDASADPITGSDPS